MRDTHWCLSRLPPKVGSSPCSGGFRRRWSSSHRQSTFNFPFVLSCFSTHLVSIPSFTCCVFNPLFPQRLCMGLFIIVLVHVPREHTTGYFCAYLPCCSGCCWFCLINIWILPSSDLLRLTSLPPITHPATVLEFPPYYVKHFEYLSW
jgi:hypothetical protein